VDVTPARTYDELGATKTRAEERLGLSRNALPLIRTMVPEVAHPVWARSIRQDGTFSRADFTFHKDRKV
jgi:hypothetical protein